MSSREEQIDDWINREHQRQERRKRVIPSSTDRLVDNTSVGEAVETMEKIAVFLGGYPDAPRIGVAQIGMEEVTFQFEEKMDLPGPFEEQVSDNGTQVWTLTHADAEDLPSYGHWAPQCEGLTALGNSIVGAKILLNITTFRTFSILGTEEFMQAVMVGQVMEQATALWSRGHHIWLVGYGELAEKLIVFLRSHHDEELFHTADSLNDLDPELLEEERATLYVMGADADALVRFKSFQNPDVGMVIADIATSEAMSLNEEDDGVAAIDPMNLKIIPNAIYPSHEYFQAMEAIFAHDQQTAAAAAAAVENLDPSDFLDDGAGVPDEDLEAESEGITDEDLHSWLAEVSVADAEDSVQGLEADDEPTVDLADPSEEEPAEPNELWELSLLGRPATSASANALGGQAAEVVALLSLEAEAHEGGVPAARISEALWETDAPEGATARTRRSRLAKKVNAGERDLVETSEGWKPQVLSTDVDVIAAGLAGADEPALLVLLEQIQPPLQDCGQWAHQHQTAIRDRLLGHLQVRMDQALEAGALELAQALLRAKKTLTEGEVS